MDIFDRLEDKDFLTETNGSYKLSIKFTDWLGKNTGGFHYPFGEFQRPIEQVGQNDWWFLKGNKGGLDSNSFARCHYPIAAVAENNKMSDDSTGKTLVSHLFKMLHFILTLPHLDNILRKISVYQKV